ncbi:hypothetical protein OF83DRAFT_794334 [Amylostereum chailletii]|nr:hypothetical protein OF83DRAFT_794334 [Amylostereum chailletii]
MNALPPGPTSPRFAAISNGSTDPLPHLLAGLGGLSLHSPPQHRDFLHPLPPQRQHSLPQSLGQALPQSQQQQQPQQQQHMLTPSGSTFAEGGRVQNLSPDPLAPCVLFWPDNEPLPEPGQLRPHTVVGLAHPPILNTGNRGPIEHQPGDWVCRKCNYLNWRRRKVCQTCYPYAEGNGDSISATVQANRIASLKQLLDAQQAQLHAHLQSEAPQQSGPRREDALGLHFGEDHGAGYHAHLPHHPPALGQTHREESGAPFALQTQQRDSRAFRSPLGAPPPRSQSYSPRAPPTHFEPRSQSRSPARGARAVRGGFGTGGGVLSDGSVGVLW